MLSQTKMVIKARKVLEKLYDGTCDIIEHKKIRNEHGQTVFKEEIVLQNVPCRLAYKNLINGTQDNGVAAKTEQITVLIVNPDVVIPSGSKLVVSQNKRITAYSQSGEPAVYNTHQEVMLKLFEGWS